MSHVDLPTLFAYWLGELDESREAAIEEHYLACAACSAQLAEVEALSEGVRRAFASGSFGTVVTPAFAERLRGQGMRLREYRVACNGSVNCSVGPEDQVLVSRLQAPLEGVERIDLVIKREGTERRLEDVPFDAAGGEVVVLPSIAYVRTLPTHTFSWRLLAVGAEGERLLGEYVFNHSRHR
jgi:hypothetical protein